jgi:hypothetical protein
MLSDARLLVRIVDGSASKYGTSPPPEGFLIESSQAGDDAVAISSRGFHVLATIEIKIPHGARWRRQLVVGVIAYRSRARRAADSAYAVNVGLRMMVAESLPANEAVRAPAQADKSKSTAEAAGLK